jgi:hypothetical protein
MTLDLCKGCGVCCTDLNINHYTYVSKFGKEKPAGERCEALKQSEEGEGVECSIYNDPTKPTVCRTYLCGWRESHQPHIDLRPDKSGVLFSGRQTKKSGLLLEIRELSKNKLATEEGKKIVQVVTATAEIKKATVFIYNKESEKTGEVQVRWSAKEQKKREEENRKKNKK